MPTATEQVPAIGATWDDDAKVWVAESDDVPGLATEAASRDALMAKLRYLIPDLVELNERDLPREIPFELLARQSSGPRAPHNEAWPQICARVAVHAFRRRLPFPSPRSARSRHLVQPNLES
jgi:hypothetical protein